MLTMRIQPSGLMHLLHGQWLARVIKVLNLLLIMWLAYWLMQLTKLFMPALQANDAMELGHVAVTIPEEHVIQVSADQLAEMHLFGVPVAEQAFVGPVPNDAPDTRLEIVLHGTFSSDDSRLSHAIITDTSGKDGNYSVGDEISDGIMVHHILTDRVILVNNHRYETLHLLRDDVNDMVIAPGPDATHTSAGIPTLKQPKVSLNDLTSPQPVRVGGKFIGFRLKPHKATNLLDKLGLNREDVITRINEIDLDNPMKGVRALKSISSGDYVNMTVRRKGQDVALSFYMP